MQAEDRLNTEYLYNHTLYITKFSMILSEQYISTVTGKPCCKDDEYISVKPFMLVNYNVNVTMKNKKRLASHPTWGEMYIVMNLGSYGKTKGKWIHFAGSVPAMISDQHNINKNGVLNYNIRDMNDDEHTNGKP